MNSKFILLSFLLSIALNAKNLHAQKNTSVAKRLKKQSFVISSNVIYNYFTNKTMVTMINPDGKVPNSTQVVYYWQYKYYDTYTFDLSLQYNKFLSQFFSLSAGIRLDQLKSVQKTHLYIDSSSYLPDWKKLTYNSYSLSLPVSGNVYLNRFKLSLGVYAYVFTLTRSVYLDEYDVERKFSNHGYELQFFMRESVAFKLYKDRGIYLQAGLFHDLNFKNNYGYNKFFTLGVSFEPQRL